MFEVLSSSCCEVLNHQLPLPSFTSKTYRFDSGALSMDGRLDRVEVLGVFRQRLWIRLGVGEQDHLPVPEGLHPTAPSI